MKLLPYYLVAVLIVALPLGSSAQEDASQDSRDTYAQAVVGLHVTYQTWDDDRPWAKKQPNYRTASAVLIDETHLLTTAQMLSDATFIQLGTFGRQRPYEPRIVYIDRGINLALLAIDDPAVLEGLVPIHAVAASTPTSGILRTVRWRGQQLESAASRVTRFTVGAATGSQVEHAFLHMRTDIANGGWADPVFDNSHLVGITVSQSGQESRAIPAEILTAFLERANETGSGAGFATLGARWQINRDPALTEYLGQQGEPQGVVIRQVPWGTSACGVLLPQDLLLEIDGESIDAEGHYQDERLGRLQFNHLLAVRYRPGDSVSAKVLRNRKELEIEMTARTYPAELDLIPSARQGGPPYAIVGGLVMRELDRPYLSTWGKDWNKQAPDALLTRYHFDRGAHTRDRRRLVLITSVLPSPYNLGYQNLRDEIVESINGMPIDSIPDVLEALRHPQRGAHVVDLTAESSRGRIVLDAATFDAATQKMLDAYQVPAAFRLSETPLPEGGGDCPGEGG